MLGEVQSRTLLGRCHPQAQPRNQVEHLQYYQGDHEGVRHRGGDGDDLRDHLSRVALDNAGRLADDLHRKYAYSQRAPDASDSVYGENLQSVIDTDPVPEVDGDVA